VDSGLSDVATPTPELLSGTLISGRKKIIAARSFPGKKIIAARSFPGKKIIAARSFSGKKIIAARS
jgi:hypothetical protein